MPDGEDHGGLAEEPQKKRRKRQGDRRQEDERVSDQCITIVLTPTPHDGHLDRGTWLGFYNAGSPERCSLLTTFCLAKIGI